MDQQASFLLIDANGDTKLWKMSCDTSLEHIIQAARLFSYLPSRSLVHLVSRNSLLWTNKQVFLFNWCQRTPASFEMSCPPRTLYASWVNSFTSRPGSWSMHLILIGPLMDQRAGFNDAWSNQASVTCNTVCCRSCEQKFAMKRMKKLANCRATQTCIKN